jgi:hypothetical protein
MDVIILPHHFVFTLLHCSPQYNVQRPSIHILHLGVADTNILQQQMDITTNKKFHKNVLMLKVYPFVSSTFAFYQGKFV